MNCPYCGEDNPAGSQFCGSCGNALSPKPDPASSLASPSFAPPSAAPDSPNPIPSPPTTTFIPSPPPIAGRPGASPIAGRPVGERGQLTRSTRQIPTERSNKLLILYGLLLVIVVGVLVVYFVSRSPSSASTTIGGTPEPTPDYSLGIGTAVPNEGNAHVSARTVITYNVYPPSSGTHYPDTAPYKFYDEEVPEGNFVHSMEHGGVVLYYRPDISDDVKQQLKDLFNKLPPNKFGSVSLVVTPYTKGMTQPLAIAAWGRLLLMNDYNFDEIKTFYQSWVDKGPESVP
ncbi:MAG: DUF3105 domain-containing protein [Chloroflexia bacterium]